MNGGNNMRKLAAVILGVTMLATVFTGCGKKANENNGNPPSGATVTEVPSSEGENKGNNEGKKEALKIAIVSSPSGVDDGNFNQDNYTGILNFIKNHPDATVTPVKEPTGDTTAAIQAVADIVADYDVIVCCGFQFAGIGTLAQDNPNVDFILVDAYPIDAEGNEITVENIYAMQFAEQESGFFAGMAAALESKTKKVALVSGIAYPSNVNYQFGFESGVNYANKKYDTGVTLIQLPM